MVGVSNFAFRDIGSERSLLQYKVLKSIDEPGNPLSVKIFLRRDFLNVPKICLVS